MKILSTLLAVLALWLSLPQASGAQTPKVTTLLGKPVATVENVLGKPKHVAASGERYYKAAGVVRVVAVFSEQKTLEVITYQFAPGKLKDEAEALTRVGVAESAPLARPWFPQWSAPGSSGNDELTITKAAETKPEKTQRLKPTRHFLQRLQERGIPEKTAYDLLENGKRFYDPKNDSYIYWKDGIYIAVAPDGALKTAIRGPIASRWRPL